MQADRTKILVESIKRLLRRGATSHLSNIAAKTHAADLSVVFRSLSVSQQRQLFDLITDIEQKGILFSELDADTFLDLIEEIPVEDDFEFRFAVKPQYLLEALKRGTRVDLTPFFETGRRIRIMSEGFEHLLGLKHLSEA